MITTILGATFFGIFISLMIWVFVFATVDLTAISLDKAYDVGFANSVSNASDMLSSIDFLVPVSLLFYLLGIVITIELAFITLKLVMGIKKGFFF